MRSASDLRTSSVIDGQGKVWVASDPRLAASVGAAISGSMLTRFGVMNLGWVEVRTVGNSLHLRCRPRHVAPAALGMAYYILHDRSWRALAMSMLGSSWAHVILRDPGQVVDLLASVTGAQPADAGSASRFLRQSERASASPLLRPLADAQQIMLNGELSIEKLAAIDQMLGGRWSISHIDEMTGRLVFDHMGQGFTRIGPDWMGGREFAPSSTGISDSTYEQWVSSFRRQVAERRQPVFDAVDAWVSGASGDLARLRYHRVTAPVSAGGRRLLLSASTVDLAIDLRKAA